MNNEPDKPALARLAEAHPIQAHNINAAPSRSYVPVFTVAAAAVVLSWLVFIGVDALITDLNFNALNEIVD